MDYDSDLEGDACDDDVDGDGVKNAADACGFTEVGVVVGTNGCSLDQLCPCEGPMGSTESWRNHGKFVSCIGKSSESFVDLGLITDA